MVESIAKGTPATKQQFGDGETPSNDFAARMQWTITVDRTKANHAPVIDFDESGGPEPLISSIEAGEEIILDASKIYDPDGDKLKFNWS